MESSLEKRLQTVLREALGSDDLIVIVNVAIRSEASQDEPEILPGVPVKQTQSTDVLADYTGVAMPMVSRLSATIMVDQALEAKDVEFVTKVATGILGISTARGDTLNVEKITFHKPRTQSDPLRYFTAAGTVLWLIFAVVAVVLLQRSFLGPLITNLRDLSAAALMRERAGERPAAAEAEPAAADSPRKEAGAAVHTNGVHSARSDHPFSFVEPGDLPKLVYILRHTSIAEAATIIQYLPPDLAAQVVAELDPAIRGQVIGLLSDVTQLDAERVRPVEESLRKRIDFLIGGEDKLVELLDGLPFSMQNDLMTAMSAAKPAMAKAVGRRLVFIDDLAGLEPAEIKLLSRRVPAKLLAVLMKSSPKLRESVLPKLARGTKEWLTQEIELSQDPTPEALEAARRPVLAAVSQLVREGRIVLRKEGAAAAPPKPAPEPESK